MTEQKKRRRRTRSNGGGAPAAATVATTTTASGRVVPVFAPWNWRTFPVYFALTGGLFFGIYLGMFAAIIAQDSGSDTALTVMLVGAALAFGFALSRMVSRFMVTRGLFRTRTRQPKT